MALAAVAAVACGGKREAEDPAKTWGNVDDARLANAHKEPQNWLSYNGGWQEHRYSSLDQINVDNIAQLKPAWYVEFDTNRGQESTPIVVDGVLYVTTAWSKVHAVDAKTGKQIWYYDPKAPGSSGVPACCDVVNRGVAVYKGKVFLGTTDGRLVALDAGTGKEVWVANTVPANSIYTITGAPRVARDKVFIGNGGADFGGRGFVSAYDTESGKLVWRFYTVPGDPNAAPDGAASDEAMKNVAAPTWFGEWYKYGGGGHVWNSIVYDPDFNQLYMATGNGFPWNPNFRSAGKGDNLFIASIVAVDADTGKYKWHYQESPGDGWDFDSISDMTLADLDIGGQNRKVLLHPPKNGFFYVIDRQTGKLVSAEPYVGGITWAKRVDVATGKPEISPEALYKDKAFTGSPGGGGAHNWHPTAFNPKIGLIYLQATEGSSTYYEPVKKYEYNPDRPSIGIDFAKMAGGGAHGADTLGKKQTPAPAAAPPKSFLLAWDPVAQKAAWRTDTRGGGVLATGGNLLFQGRGRAGVLGELVAYRADTGEKIWSHATPNAISAGPITYSVDGEQYIAVAAGAGMMAMGSPARARQSGRLLVFKLNGTGALPAEPPLAAPANPPQAVAAAADVAEGANHYDDYCTRCHGVQARNGNVIPDLRRSVMLTQPDAWQSIVSKGALTDRGMIGWSKYLNADQVEKIRLYVGEQARKLQAESASAQK
jgi:quinohemoprotein ethanol dehydrogenase